MRIFQILLCPFKKNKQNKFFLKSFVEDGKPIYAFFHIYAANDWKKIVTELIDDVRQSGLYDRLHHIFVTAILSEDKDLCFIKREIGDKGSIEFVTNERTVYEFPALELLLEKAKADPEFYCLYFHTKGSSNSINTKKEYGLRSISGSKLVKNATSARKFMSFWNFYNWKTAISVLQAGFPTYGCNLIQISENSYIYGGNFWWANSAYISTRNNFNIKNKQSRFYAEGWLLENTERQPYNAYSVSCGANSISIPKSVYQNKGISKLPGLMAAYKNMLFFYLSKVKEKWFKK